MRKLRMMLIWLGRIHRCRGFGIQSPWAYRFVRYVINEHYPYYGYGDVESGGAVPDPVGRKLGRLYMRIANHVRPATIISYGGDDDTALRYFKAGCATARTVSFDAAAGIDEVRRLLHSLDAVSVMRLRPEGSYREVFNEARLKAADGAVIIIEGIKAGDDARRFWREVVRLVDGVITFDLYYCGLVCFRPKMYKRNYVVNF